MREEDDAAQHVYRAAAADAPERQRIRQRTYLIAPRSLETWTEAMGEKTISMKQLFVTPLVVTFMSLPNSVGVFHAQNSDALWTCTVQLQTPALQSNLPARARKHVTVDQHGTVDAFGFRVWTRERVVEVLNAAGFHLSLRSVV